jgi:quercetin dioxygenase-like cupin family protein
MDTNQQPATGPRVLGPKDGEVAGAPESRTDRFMIDGADTAGRLSVVEHTVPPHVLAGPLHYHSREDEYSYVLEGQLGAVLGDQEVIAEAGDLVFKPRGQWHTFWNPGDTPTRILELITPAGLEDLFRELGTPAWSWTRRPCRRWRRAMAARSTSRPPRPSCSATGCGSRRPRAGRSAHP